MKLINRYLFFVLITFSIILILLNGKTNAGTSITNQGIKFPDGTVQTTKAIETGTGHTLSVYSADGQYLGVALSDMNDALNIFIPSIKMFCIIYSMGIDGYADLTTVNHYYETTDCTGTPFYASSFHSSVISNHIYKALDGSYETIGQRINKGYQSFSVSNQGGCNITMNVVYIYAYELIAVPSLPFTTPIKLPLTYEYK